MAPEIMSTADKTSTYARQQQQQQLQQQAPITSLQDLCIRTVSAGFADLRPPLAALPEAARRRVVEGLSLDLDVELAGAAIADEDYWRRRCRARWRGGGGGAGGDVAAHGRSWKQLFFERHVQGALEAFDPASQPQQSSQQQQPSQQQQLQQQLQEGGRLFASGGGGTDADLNGTGLSGSGGGSGGGSNGSSSGGSGGDPTVALRRLLTFSRRFVRSVRAARLPSRLDPAEIFDAMGPAVASLSLCYGPGAVGADYDRRLFGMRLSDCRSLARALVPAEALVHLCLAGNGIDDDRMLMLAAGLADNASLTHLDLSHNRIGDCGARALARAISGGGAGGGGGCQLAVLSLCDNEVHADGGRALARALRGGGSSSGGAGGGGTSSALVSLDLRLNRLGDAGCRAVLEALVPRGGAGGGTIGDASGSGGGGGGHQPAALERLSIAANGAGAALVASLAAALRGATGAGGAAFGALSQLDASGNALGAAAGPALLAAARDAGPALAALDLRGCGLRQEDEAAVDEVLLALAERRALAALGALPGMAQLSAATAG